MIVFYVMFKCVYASFMWWWCTAERSSKKIIEVRCSVMQIIDYVIFFPETMGCLCSVISTEWANGQQNKVHHCDPEEKYGQKIFGHISLLSHSKPPHFQKWLNSWSLALTEVAQQSLQSHLKNLTTEVSISWGMNIYLVRLGGSLAYLRNRSRMTINHETQTYLVECILQGKVEPCPWDQRLDRWIVKSIWQ